MGVWLKATEHKGGVVGGEKWLRTDDGSYESDRRSPVRASRGPQGQGICQFVNTENHAKNPGMVHPQIQRDYLQIQRDIHKSRVSLQELNDFEKGSKSIQMTIYGKSPMEERKRRREELATVSSQQPSVVDNVLLLGNDELDHGNNHFLSVGSGSGVCRDQSSC